ncbi:DUF3995 domain-containing protein [Corynebacterium nuruki]|uniref:DUF3995 domain-containing protein n=1 Tax=Corynebacterium nuruki TaxID=1032851 RepID=UPI0039BF4E74
MDNPAPVAARAAYSVAAVAGVVHGGFSIYWGIGGAWLVDTLGEDLVEQWQEHPALLLPVGVVKILAALLPLLLLRSPGQPGKPGLWHRLLQVVSWAGAVLLSLWGGVNTVTGNLVLSGIVEPDGGYDHDGMVGHAWLWDPLFLLWGVALAVGLWLSRRVSCPRR